MVRQNVIQVQWNVSFVPDSLISLVWFSRRIPFTKTVFFNVLNKEKIRSLFSWAAFGKFLERILCTGIILLPHAVIVGSTELSFKELDCVTDSSEKLLSSEVKDNLIKKQKTWVLFSSKESINLVRSIDSGILKNRKLAADLLQFLDARKPANLDLSDWNDILLDRINTRSVPGMGQFDIDGLEGVFFFKIIINSH
jgi:hypothetical protein